MKKTALPVLVAVLVMIVPALIKPAYAACATPAGNAGAVIYNSTQKIFQYCNDTQWIGMNSPGSGSGPCANPSYAEGQLVFSSQHRMLQGCAGSQWRAMGKPPSTSWATPALAYSLPGPAAASMFGRTVAISGNLIALAAPAETVGGFAGAGQAYVYNATTGALVSTLVNPDLTTSDRMGRTGLGISGNLVVVGAFDDDPGGLSSAGSAYVFNATTGALVSTLNPPSQAAGDLFGTSAAISGDLVVVGATDAGVNDAGEAYVFNATTGALVSTLVNPDPVVGDNFGVNVAISGNLVVVGDNFDDPGGVSGAGSAYIFNATTGTLVTTLSNPNPVTNDRFGEAVAIEGNLAVVTALLDDLGAADAGAAYVFNATTGTLISTLRNPNPTLNDEFGGRSQVGLSNGIVVLGAQLDDAGTTDAGIAYAFDALTGNLLGTLNNPDPTTDDSFGYASGLSGDIAVISAYQDDPGGVSNAGSVYVFKAQLPAIANCAAPTGTPGTIFYSSQYNVLQYCNGASWVGMSQLAVAEPCAGSPAAGTVCGDGTIYAGISPDGNVKMYTTPANATGSPMDWGPGGDISIVNCLAALGPQAGCRTGRANTEIMAAIGGGYTAAEYCASLTAHGHSDWYLPAQHELDVLFFNQGAIGNFPTDVYYWSSSEQGSSFAWHESFGGGAMGNNSKVNVYHVRCVRK